MKRRTFIAGSTSLLAAGSFSGKWSGVLASSLNTSPPGFLVFEISEDGRQIIVIEKAFTEQRGASQNIGDRVLRIMASQFGDKTTFRLGRLTRPEDTRHVVYIDNAAIGSKKEISHRLIFKRESTRDHWSISLRTTAFGNPLRTAPIGFREFVYDVPLKMTIRSTLVATALTDISGGRMSVQGNGNCEITVDCHFTWRVEKQDKTSFVALGGRLAGKETIEMRWSWTGSEAPPASDAGKFVATQVQINPIHLIKVAVPAFAGIDLEDAQKRQLNIRAVKAGDPAQLCVFHRPDDLHIATPSLAVLSLAQGTIQSIVALGKYAFSALTVRDLYLMERLEESGELRIVISANLAHDIPVECHTAAGTLMVASLQSMSVANNSSRRLDDEQRQEQIAKSRAKSIVQDSKPEPDPLEVKLKSYLALLAPNRPYGDPATIYIVAHSHGRPDKLTVIFQTIVISAALHAIDRALPGSQWSSLRFGVLPNQMQRRSKVATNKDDKQLPGKTAGTAFDLIYPMPATLRTNYPVVVAIFPEESTVLARLSMDRAQLDVASSEGLVDLSFGFRGLSLLLGGGSEPRLRPDNSGCQVQRMPDGSLIDTRPVLIIDLPPQHVLEEAWFSPAHIDKAQTRLDQSLAQADVVIDNLRKRSGSTSSDNDLRRVDLARLLEGQVESADPFYALWREFFRDTLLDKPVDLEFFASSNRAHLDPASLPAYDDWVDSLKSQFITQLAKVAVPPDVMRARLSGRSRLAFRMRCDTVSDDLGILGSVPFTLSQLTMLGRLEPAVTRRAELLARPLPDGRVPAAAEASYDNIDGTTVLGFQGIVGGARSVFSHMDSVRSALARGPKPEETSLELVSRLIFSPSQRAIFLTDASVPDTIFVDGPPQKAGGTCTELPRFRLWSLRLLTDGRFGPHSSDIRVVATPDYRAEALRPWPAGLRDEVFGAPPYGNQAPWLMPRAPAMPDDCAEPAAPPAVAGMRKSLIEKCLKVLSGDVSAQRREMKFRSGLSANDRHQLLLLSGAYGLPVIGKRKPDQNGKPGELVADSDQFSAEPGYTLAELDSGQAIYAPRTLDVSELALSALGATFRHDTHFNPPLPALLLKDRGAPEMFDQRPAFDGLSICRWEHNSLSSRDLRVRVAYKGYLMPTGHQATFVKLTERRIVHTADGDLRAVLVQRMYITLSTPELTFPRLEQPYAGRGWPCAKIVVQDPSAISIADPYEPSGGRVSGLTVGLAFWPNTASDHLPLNFSLAVGGATTETQMMFVDNVAIGDPAVLAMLANEYNQKTSERIWSFGGAKVPYAPAKKRGDTDICTQRLSVRVTGRNIQPLPPDQWVGPCDRFGSLPALEGAGEPPFFPALEWTEIGLDSVEKLVGAKAQTVRAFYDGCYVREGFSESGDKALHPNPMEIYLHFNGEGPTLDVGNNGDKTAGMARPNAVLRAFSRVLGPVGHEEPTFKDGPSSERCKRFDPPECKLLTEDQYRSIVHLYDAGPVEARTAKADDAATPAAPGTGAAIDIAKNFFASDAKLLGTITFAELFKLVDGNGSLADILPALEQSLDFGLAVADTAENIRKLLKERVLLPLSDLLQAFETQWKELERELQKRSLDHQDTSKPSSLASLFPSLNGSRELLRTRLNESIAEEDPLQMPGRLSALQEAAGRFLQALSEFARRPAETFAAGLRALLDQNMSNLRSILVQSGMPVLVIDLFQRVAKDPAGFDKALRQAIAQAVIKAVKTQLENSIPDRYRLIPWPDLPRILKDDANDYQNVFSNTFGALQFKESDLADALEALLQNPGAEPVLLAKTLTKPILDAAKAARVEIQQRGLLTKTRALELMDDYVEQLEALTIELDGQLNKSPVSNHVKTLLGRINADRDRLLTLCNQLSGLKASLDKGDLPSIFTNLSGLALEAGGPLYLGSVKKIDEAMKTAAKDAVSAFKSIPPPGQPEVDVCEKLAGEYSDIDPIRKLGKVDSEPLKQIRELIVAVQPLPNAVRKFDKEFQDSWKKLKDKNGIDALKGLAQQINDGIDTTQTFLVALQKDLGQLCCGVVMLEKAAQSIYVEDVPNDDPAAMFARLLKVQELLSEQVLKVALQLVTTIGAYVKNEGALLATGAALQGLKASLPDYSGEVLQAVQAIVDAALTLQKDADAFATRLLEALNAILLQLDAIARVPLDRLEQVLTIIIESKLTMPAGLFDVQTLALIENGRLQVQLAADTFKPFDRPNPVAGESPLDTILRMQRADNTTLQQFVTRADPFAGANKALEVAQELEQRLFQHIQYRINGLPVEMLKLLEPFVQDVLKSGAKGLRQTYQTLFDARKTLIEWLDANASWIDKSELDAALSPPEGEDQDALSVERTLLSRLSDDVSISTSRPDRSTIMELASRWAEGQAAPVLILKGMQSIIERVLRGDVLSLIDISGLRDEIEDRISALVPTRQTLRYDFGVSLTTPNADALFAPQAGCRFEIGVRSEVDLLNPDQFTFETNGSIGAFNINLVHEFGVQAIRLIFGGATFRMARGEKVSFNADFQDFEIGPALKFVQQLQESLSIGASGVYLEPLRGKPGIRVGYGLDIGVITLGALSFSNVTVGIAADLPFSDDQALFSVSLGRRLAPFMISALPWAGSGYLAILSTAQAIVGFEMGLEFGVGGAFKFGPLVGQGRIQAGFAIRTVQLENGKRATEISGTFFAGGSANIWIFTFAACLYVRLTMDSESGSMKGEAVFAFSFKVGFAQFSYQVRAHYSQNKLSDDGGKGGASDGQKKRRVGQVSARDPYFEIASNHSGGVASAPLHAGSSRSGEAIRNTASMKNDWGTYSKYFDFSLLR